MDKIRFLVPPGSACRQSFAGFMTVLATRCKITRRRRWRRLEVVKLYGFRVMLVFVMYYIYVTSGPSLLIESTDSMIVQMAIYLTVV